MLHLKKNGLNSNKGKEIKEIQNANIICPMYNFLSSSEDSDDLTIGFHRDNTIYERGLTNQKTTKTIYLLELF